jgi:hypothetical protein
MFNAITADASHGEIHTAWHPPWTYGFQPLQ